MKENKAYIIYDKDLCDDCKKKAERCVNNVNNYVLEQIKTIILSLETRGYKKSFLGSKIGLQGQYLSMLSNYEKYKNIKTMSISNQVQLLYRFEILFSELNKQGVQNDGATDY